ncbi:MAG: hypothetical protein LUG99_01005 [Lachnospiraceae bacterium]|nr:hypothetical protein [Lachnospiraceae bacterium]
MKRVKDRHLKIAMLGHKTVPAMDSSRGGIEVVETRKTHIFTHRRGYRTGVFIKRP